MSFPRFTRLLPYIVRREGKKFKEQDGALVEVRTIEAAGSEVELIESYKERNVVCDGPTIMVHDPKGDTLFIVSMDDSKSSGKRTFDEAFNTVEAARDYIDWLK